MNKYIAKTNSKNQYLSLETHSSDTVVVMNHLLTHYCTESIYRAAQMSRDSFEATARFLSAIHDVGKATSAFQKKINGSKTEFRHALAGASILNQVFDVNETICDIVAAHHGKPRDKQRNENLSYYFKKNKAAIGNDKETWQGLFEAAVGAGGENLNLSCKVSIEGQMILCGLLIMADWIASNEDYFPLLIKEDTLSSDDYTIRHKKGLGKLSLPPAWEPSVFCMDDETFQARFSFLPNKVQKEAINIANHISEPGLFLIEAPMGIGKTEASLAVAEIMAAKAQCGGLFYGLPTKGTANAMLPRMVSWANVASDGMQTSFRLAHGDAKNNSEYCALKNNTNDEFGISVNEWLSGRHRALLSDFSIGTVDQVLMACLMKKFIMLLHLGIAGKVIIIDEVHAYDAYMSSYLNTLLSWAGAYKIPVILLSATLPLQKKKEFFEAYTSCSDAAPLNAIGYPSITWSDGNVVNTNNIVFKGNQKSVHIKYIKPDKCIEQIEKQEDLCAGIIVNSVKRAQYLYDELTERFPDRTIVLLHSGYLPEDRAKKEKEVIALAGKGSTAEIRKKTIIIGTQVLEQSLDIDFDVLYTEKCSIDLLLQRIGRQFRHDRPDRPVKEQYCYIIDDEESETIAKRLYTDYLIHQTDSVLGDTTINIPEDVRDLTESVYDLSKTDNSDFKEKLIVGIKEMESRAGRYIIQGPYKHASLVGLISADAGEERGVRYGNAGVEVLLWKRTEKGDISTVDESVIVHESPSLEQMNKLANQSINVPIYKIDFNEINDLKKKLPVWAQTGTFKHKLVLIMAENSTCKTKKFEYKYDNKYGLKTEKTNE